MKTILQQKLHIATSMQTPLTILLLLLLCPSYSSSSSTPYYNVYNYDLTTPQFTPDGRLKQVEYASSASAYSSPLLALPLFLDKKCIGVVMACSKGRRSGQSRIVHIPIGPQPSSSSSGSGGMGSVVVGLSGVLSDNVALIENARKDALESWHKSYGIHALHHQSPLFLEKSQSTAALATSAARRIAISIGDKCQSHSFGGGLRPYGAQIMVCGVDEEFGVVIALSDPSGSVSLYSMQSSSSSSSLKKKEEESEKEENKVSLRKRAQVVSPMVIGGSTTVQSRIRRDVRKNLADSLSEKLTEEEKKFPLVEKEKVAKTILRQGIETVVQTLVQEYKLSNPDNDNDHDYDEQQQQGGEEKNAPRGSKKNDGPLLEVVLVTSKNGVHRLSEEQVKKIRLQCLEKDVDG